jgi:PHD/YefM family antitoxin component YafN of YafNO toxin-antitoxin module
MIRATNICSLTSFTRNAKKVVSVVKETRQPYALTINGEAEVVVQDVESYQAMVDELERMRLFEALQESERDLAEGRYKDVDESFAEVRQNLGL